MDNYSLVISYKHTTSSHPEFFNTLNKYIEIFTKHGIYSRIKDEQLIISDDSEEKISYLKEVFENHQDDLKPEMLEFYLNSLIAKQEN